MLLVSNGIAVSSTTATVAAGVFVGASTALAVSAYGTAVDSNSMEEFADQGQAALVSTMVGGAAGGASAYNYPGHNCFVAGTAVLTSIGAKSIETVQPGDLVWAWDEDTGDVSLKKVVETYVNETGELVHIWADGEEIVATPSHPFYSPVKGWTDAVRLRAGDVLVLVNGEYVVVERVQHEFLESPVTVYNFQVEDYHTYYVASGVLVHNECKLTGGGHGNEKHKERIDAKMLELKDSGQYTDIYGNRSLNTAGLNGNQRPDIIAKNISGTFEVWEFASPSQATGVGYAALANKIATMQGANPDVIFHQIVPW